MPAEPEETLQKLAALRLLLSDYYIRHKIGPEAQNSQEAYVNDPAVKQLADRIVADEAKIVDTCLRRADFRRLCSGHSNFSRDALASAGMVGDFGKEGHRYGGLLAAVLSAHECSYPEFYKFAQQRINGAMMDHVRTGLGGRTKTPRPSTFSFGSLGGDEDRGFVEPQGTYFGIFDNGRIDQKDAKNLLLAADSLTEPSRSIIQNLFAAILEQGDVSAAQRFHDKARDEGDAEALRDALLELKCAYFQADDDHLPDVVVECKQAIKQSSTMEELVRNAYRLRDITGFTLKELGVIAGLSESRMSQMQSEGRLPGKMLAGMGVTDGHLPKFAIPHFPPCWGEKHVHGQKAALKVIVNESAMAHALAKLFEAVTFRHKEATGEEVSQCYDVLKAGKLPNAIDGYKGLSIILTTCDIGPELLPDWFIERIASYKPSEKVALPEMHENVLFSKQLEKSFRQGRNFRQFFFEDLLPQWHDVDGKPLDDRGFCELLTRIVEKPIPVGTTETSKPVISEAALASWRKERSRPGQNTVELFAEAFHLNIRHEVMLHRMMHGRTLSESPQVLEQARAALPSRAALLQVLTEASGMSRRNLYRLSGGQFVHAMHHGEFIGNTEVAKRFLNVVLPPALYPPSEQEAIAKAHEELLPLITGAPKTLQDAIEQAQCATYPPGQFLALLTGRHGLFRMTVDEIATLISTPEHPVGVGTVRSMRIGKTTTSAKQIYEHQAQKIMDVIKARMGGTLSPETYEQAVTLLTGIETPHKLIESCWLGKMDIGDAIKLIRTRKAMESPTIPIEGGETVKVADVQRGAHALPPEDGRSVAKTFGLQGEDIYRFAILASWVDRSVSPDAILDAARSGQMPTREAIKQLIPHTGHSYEGLSEALGVSFNQLRGWVGNHSGRINVPEAIPKFAALVGLSERLDEFTSTFGSPLRGGICRRNATQINGAGKL